MLPLFAWGFDMNRRRITGKRSVSYTSDFEDIDDEKAPRYLWSVDPWKVSSFTRKGVCKRAGAGVPSAQSKLLSGAERHIRGRLAFGPKYAEYTEGATSVWKPRPLFRSISPS